MGISISDSDISRESLLRVPDFNEKTKRNITDADVLIVPKFVEHRGQILRRFPVSAPDFAKLAKQELNEYNVKLCENEGDANTFSQKCDALLLPLLIAFGPTVLSALLNFVVNYAMHRISNKSKDVSLELVLEDGESKRVKKLSYTGNVNGLKDEIIPYAEKFFSEDEKNNAG